MRIPTVVFRVDASPRIGRGHVARCGAVARALRDRSFHVVVLSHRLSEELSGPLRLSGCSIRALDDPFDFEEASGAVRDLQTDTDLVTLVVDHYELDAQWQTAMRHVVGRVVAIEDRPVRPHNVNLLVDANGGAGRGIRYQALLPSDAQVVTGQDYALIDPAYEQWGQSTRPRDGAARRILVHLGSDRSELVEGVVAALLDMTVPGLEVDVVLAGDHDSVGRVRALANAAGWRVYTDVQDIHVLYARADLAIGAPGVSVWERCAVGLPSLVVETTARQAGAYADLISSPAISNLGQASELDPSRLTALLGREVARRDLRERSIACRRLVDGRGAVRMASLLTAHPGLPMKLREQEATDEDRLVRWSNDPWASPGSAASSLVHGYDYRRWFRRRLAEPDRFRQYLLEDAWKAEIGEVHFELEARSWRMSVDVAPGYRDRGFAAGLIARSCGRLAVDVGGQVMVTTQAIAGQAERVNALSRLGFEQDARDLPTDWIEFRRVWSPTVGGTQMGMGALANRDA